MLPDALEGARRVLVVRLDNLGDVVLTSPLFRALRQLLPSAHLTLLASPGGALAAPLIPWIDDVVTVRAVWQDLGGRLGFDAERELEFVTRLREGHYDVALILTSFSQTPYVAGYAAYLAGIAVRIGQAADFAGSVLSHVIAPAAAGTHQADRNLHLLESLGVPIADRSLAVAVPLRAGQRAESFLASSGVRDRPIVVAPGASCAARRYEPARYGLAAASLSRRTGQSVVVVGTERERQLADAVVAACPWAVSLAGRTSFVELAAIVAGAGLVLCGNSAALHLADAFGRPVVALYSGTDRESEWAPRRAPARLLRIDTFCAPCRRFECPYQMACLDVAPAHVVEAGLELMRTESLEPLFVAATASTREDRWIASAS